jgi:hypothetical protein
MTRNPSSLAAFGAALIGAAMLAACGGGGSSSKPITLGGEVYGLAPGSPLELRLQDGTVSTPRQTGAYGSSPVAFSIGSTFAAATPYTVSIVRQPQGQLCRIVRNASGVLTAAQRDVAVECHRTLLNDTGIRSSDPTLNASSAMQPDATIGRDAQADLLTKIGAGVLGFDFTRLCTSGDTVNGSGACPTNTAFGPSNAWTCTRDNVTGLVWLEASSSYDPAATAPADGLCGRAGWRMPKVRELLSLVHAGRTDPAEAAIDLDAFPNTAAQAFRAAEVYGDGDGMPWVVHFGQRGAAVKQAQGAVLLQRWVAGAAASPLADTAAQDHLRDDLGNHWVVTDKPRELMWLVPKAPAAMDWVAAVAAAAAVNAARAGGHADWRLPNRAELESLVKRGASRPALDPAVYGTDASGFSQMFWTASPGLANQGRDAAWVVDFGFGDVSLAPKAGLAKVLLVRNKIVDATL